MCRQIRFNNAEAGSIPSLQVLLDIKFPQIIIKQACAEEYQEYWDSCFCCVNPEVLLNYLNFEWEIDEMGDYLVDLAVPENNVQLYINYLKSLSSK